MAKHLLFNTNAKEKILQGMELVYNAVSSTLGPNGKTVIIEDEYGNPFATKDGVTVAKSLDFDDEFYNQSAKLLIKVAQSTNDIVGDGTTTATILAYNMVKEGLKYQSLGLNVSLLKQGMQLALTDIKNELKNYSISISNNDEIKQIATISGNNDQQIGKLISEAMIEVGKDGVITVEDSKTHEDSLEIVEGMQFDRGFLSPYFVTNNETMQTELMNPYILLYNGTLSNIKLILKNILEPLIQENRALVIIADDIQGEALGTLVVNKSRGNMKVVAIKSPGYGNNRTDILEDIAILTNGLMISSDKGIALDKVSLKDLGQCRSFTCNSKTSTIIDGNGDQDKILNRINLIKEQIDKADSDYEKQKYQNRLAKLSGGVAIIHAGAETEFALKEKKDRIEDALHATRAAIDEGIIAGGGITFLNIYKTLSKSKHKLNPDLKIGYDIVLNSIKMPFYLMLNNAGYNPDEISAKLKKDDNGFNLLTGEIVNMIENGIIDPTMVSRIALEKSVSISEIILSTDCIIVTKKEKKDEVPMME